jgi:hypothetical protein
MDDTDVIPAIPVEAHLDDLDTGPHEAVDHRADKADETDDEADRDVTDRTAAPGARSRRG